MDGDYIQMRFVVSSTRLNGRDLRSRDSLLLEARSTTPLVMEDNGGRTGREKELTSSRLYRS